MLQQSSILSTAGHPMLSTLTYRAPVTLKEIYVTLNEVKSAVMLDEKMSSIAHPSNNSYKTNKN